MLKAEVDLRIQLRFFSLAYWFILVLSSAGAVELAPWAVSVRRAEKADPPPSAGAARTSQ